MSSPDSLSMTRRSTPFRISSRIPSQNASMRSAGVSYCTEIIDFTCRLTARRNSRDIETTFTVRNATIERPQHTELAGIGLVLKTDPGGSSLDALFNTHTGHQTVALPQNGDTAHLYDPQGRPVDKRESK